MVSMIALSQAYFEQYRRSDNVLIFNGLSYIHRLLHSFFGVFLLMYKFNLRKPQTVTQSVAFFCCSYTKSRKKYIYFVARITHCKTLTPRYIYRCIHNNSLFFWFDRKCVYKKYQEHFTVTSLTPYSHIFIGYMMQKKRESERIGYNRVACLQCVYFVLLCWISQLACSYIFLLAEYMCMHNKLCFRRPSNRLLSFPNQPLCTTLFLSIAYTLFPFIFQQHAYIYDAVYIFFLQFMCLSLWAQSFQTNQKKKMKETADIFSTALLASYL